MTRRIPSIFDLVIVTRGKPGSRVLLSEEAEAERFELAETQRLFVRDTTGTHGIHVWARDAEDHDADSDFDLQLSYATLKSLDEQGVQYAGVEFTNGTARPVHVLLTRKEIGW